MRLNRVLLLGSAVALVLAASVSAMPRASSTTGQTTAGTAAFPSNAVAPAWAAADLAARPGANWLTNGGDTSNARYSSLNQINTGNV